MTFHMICTHRKQLVEMQRAQRGRSHAGGQGRPGPEVPVPVWTKLLISPMQEEPHALQQHM